MRPAPRPRLNPDRSQFFIYDPVSLSCSSEDSGPWAVLRNTSTDTRGRCGGAWGRLEGSVCTVEALFPEDGGLYWCESGKHSSEPARISVHEHREKPTTSPPSAPSPFRPSSSGLLVPLVCSGLGLLLFLLIFLLLWCKCRRPKQTPGASDDACPDGGVGGGDDGDDVTYSDILHHQQRRPIRRKEREESPVYSSVKPEDVCYSSIFINQTRDPAKKTKERTRNQNDSSTYAQVRVRTT